MKIITWTILTRKSVMVNNLKIQQCGYREKLRKSYFLFLISAICSLWLLDLDFFPWCFSGSWVLPSLSESARVITAAQTWLEPSSFQSQAHISLSYFLFLSSSSSSPQPPSSEVMLQTVFMNKKTLSAFHFPSLVPLHFNSCLMLMFELVVSDRTKFSICIWIVNCMYT